MQLNLKPSFKNRVSNWINPFLDTITIWHNSSPNNNLYWKIFSPFSSFRYMCFALHPSFCPIPNREDTSEPAFYFLFLIFVFISFISKHRKGFSVLWLAKRNEKKYKRTLGQVQKYQKACKFSCRRTTWNGTQTQSKSGSFWILYSSSEKHIAELSNEIKFATTNLLIHCWQECLTCFDCLL